MGLIVRDDVDDTVRGLNLNGSDVLGPMEPEPTAFDHGWPGHAQIRVGGGDDHVTDTSECGVAGKASPAHHGDRRRVAAEASHPRKRHDLEAGQEGSVGVARPSASALGEEHDGHIETVDNLEETVLLLMATEALGAGQNHVVVRHHCNVGVRFADEIGVDRGEPTDDAIPLCCGDQVIDTAASRLRRVHESAVLLEAVRVDQVGQVFPGGSAAAGMDLCHRLGPGGVVKERLASSELRQIGPLRVTHLHLMGLVSGLHRARQQAEQDRSGLYDRSNVHRNPFDPAVGRCRDEMFDLHHLDDGDRVTGPDRITCLHSDLDDGAIGGGGDLLHGPRVSQTGSLHHNRIAGTSRGAVSQAARGERLSRWDRDQRTRW